MRIIYLPWPLRLGLFVLSARANFTLQDPLNGGVYKNITKQKQFSNE